MERTGEGWSPDGSIFSGTITVEMAAELLENNDKNRPKKPNGIDRLTEAILDGEWIFNGDTIKVNPDGVLLDGQHRLEALIKANEKDPTITGVPSMIVWGVPEEARTTIDGGIKRSLADELAIRGEVSTTQLQALLNLVRLLQVGETAIKNPARYRLTVMQGVRMLEEFPDARDYVKLAAVIRAEMNKTASASIIGACLWHFDQVDRADSRVFWTKVGSGVELTRKDPRYALRETFSKNAASKTKKIEPMVLVAMTIKAWNFYRNGADISQLSYRLGGPSPEKWPVPI